MLLKDCCYLQPLINYSLNTFKTNARKKIKIIKKSFALYSLLKKE